MRDNLNETAPAKATATSRFFVASGANSIVEREIGHDFISTNESTGSSSYTDLTTPGPTVEVETGVAAVAWWAVQMTNNTGGETSHVSLETSGATTTAASDVRQLMYESGNASDSIRAGTIEYLVLTAGTNSNQLKYKASGGTSGFQRRRLTIFAL